MTIHIELAPAIQQRLVTLAAERGQSVEQCATDLLEESIPLKRNGSELADALRRIRNDGDVAEQKATGDLLIRTLDEDRPSDRKLFPSELEGKTW
jgi:hypothetical protein